MAQLALKSHRNYKAMVLIGPSLISMQCNSVTALRTRLSRTPELEHGSAHLHRLEPGKSTRGCNQHAAGPSGRWDFCLFVRFYVAFGGVGANGRPESTRRSLNWATFCWVASDGDGTAYKMMVNGYLDADGAQNLPLEGVASVQAIADLREGKKVPQTIVNKALVVTQSNLHEIGSQMWGSRFEQNRSRSGRGSGRGSSRDS